MVRGGFSYAKFYIITSLAPPDRLITIAGFGLWLLRILSLEWVVMMMTVVALVGAAGGEGRSQDFGFRAAPCLRQKHPADFTAGVLRGTVARF